MRNKLGIAGGVFLVVVSMGCGQRGDTQPKADRSKEQPGGPEMLSYEEFTVKFPDESRSALRALREVASAPRCSPEPTQQEINTSAGQYQDYFMSAKRAASIGIPIMNSSFKSDYLVIVRDYRRFKPCTATDGKTTLHYGQVIRAVIELTEYASDTNLGLASLAASATLNGKRQLFYLYRSGWYSPKADKVLAEVSGKVFDVENYALYQSVMPQLIDMLSDASTSLAPTEILRIPASDDPAFLMASARAFAFQQAKDGKSCLSASRKFSKDVARAAAVVDAYAFLGKQSCTDDPVVEPDRSRAANLLGDLGVR